MNLSNQLEESIKLKVKTRSEIADEYGITIKTLVRRLAKMGIELPPGYIFPNTLKVIYSSLGVPSNLITKLKRQE